MNTNDGLKTLFIERFRRGWLDLIERTGQAKPPDFDQIAKANAEAAFDLLTPAEVTNLRLDVAINAEVQRCGGPAAYLILPDKTRMIWNEVQKFADWLKPADAKCVVLMLEGMQAGGLLGCAQRLTSFLKANGRRLITVATGSVHSASACLISAADYAIATTDALLAYHGGVYDSQYPVRMTTEDIAVYPGTDINKADGAPTVAMNAHLINVDAQKFFPKFRTLLGGQDLQAYFSQPIFSRDVQVKLFAALNRALPSPDDLEKRTFTFFWETVYGDRLFTRLSAPEAHALGAIDIVV